MIFKHFSFHINQCMWAMIYVNLHNYGECYNLHAQETNLNHINHVLDFPTHVCLHVVCWRMGVSPRRFSSHLFPLQITFINGYRLANQFSILSNFQKT